MYQYDHFDHQMVNQRIAQFRDQTMRFLNGELSAEDFRPLRLQNGLYIQRHAPMLRVAIPYGLLSSSQMRKLAWIAENYDRGYGHFSTRQNIQFNWPALENVPDILQHLADVEMHAIQTSGNCIRNTTSDQFAGVAFDEKIDPRPWCEIIRQWSTFHPEFAFLPRKFKIAVNGAEQDRAAIQVHDIGLNIKQDVNGEVGFEVLVGGGLGRTPIIGSVINPFIPWQHLLTYLEAILRIYNRYGRRDNKYKARIKILVKALTPEGFASKVAQEWGHLKNGPGTIRAEEVARVTRFFQPPAYQNNIDSSEFLQELENNKAFAAWYRRNTFAHKQTGYRAVTLSLKASNMAPGDATTAQMMAVADMADKFSFGEIRVSHMQNLILADVKQSDLLQVWQEAKNIGFATPNIGTITDIICCPGGDFCDLANAKSIPIANSIQSLFDELDYLYDIGDLDLNISGCMNSCGHHHVGHIGILGVDKNNSEWYQISLGGNQGNQTALGKVIGPSFAQSEVPNVIEKIIAVYLETRVDEERFIETYARIGIEPFKERVYAKNH